MSPVSVLTGPPHDCKTDGHIIALRAKRDLAGPECHITAFCELCHNVYLPSTMWVGRHADELMKIVAAAQRAPDAPPEAYEGLYE